MGLFSSTFDIMADCFEWITKSEIRMAVASLILAMIFLLNFKLGKDILHCIFNINATNNTLTEFDETDGFDDEYDQLIASYYDKLHENVKSPINIDPQRTITKEIFERLRWTGYRTLPKSLILKNTGNSVVLQAEFDRDGPYLSGANLRTHYDFIELTFKWGWQSGDGSEHMLNFNKFSMELQAVHKSGPIMNDGVIGYDMVTVAYFFDKSLQDNVYLDPICENLKFIQETKTQVLIKPFPLYLLLIPFQSGFYSYYGTLSDCPKSVYTNWFIYPNQFEVSDRQLQQFRQLKNFDGLPMIKTSRLLKPLGCREVMFQCYNSEEEDIF